MLKLIGTRLKNLSVLNQSLEQRMPKAKNGAIKNVMAFPFCIAISKTIIKTTSTSPLEILLFCPSDFSCSREEVNALQVYPCDLGLSCLYRNAK